MKTLREQAAEEFHDSGGVQRRQRQELAFGSEDAVGYNGMKVGVEIGPIGTEALERDHTTRTDVAALKQRVEGVADESLI